jgi:hypothetical protein
VFPHARSEPVQLDLKLRGFGSLSRLQQAVCLGFKALTKLGAYRLALRLSQAAWRYPRLASLVGPFVVHVAVVVRIEE